MEKPAARPRGRPRKRSIEEEEETVGKSVVDAKSTRSVALVGRYVLKEFPENGVFLGKVVYYETGLYRVNYEDGDSEDLDSDEIRPILLRENDFDADLVKRRRKLGQLVARKRAKAAAAPEKASAESKKEESAAAAAAVPVSSELNGENGGGGEAGVMVVYSSSDSGLKERSSGSDAETPPMPPPLELPPSSGTVGVPELSVSHLFAVYGFLRSFSTLLFLMPFTLEDFVGCLNFRGPNSLFDAIHVSLMRALRRHLETLSSEGSELALQCFRCNDWSLLDTLTWSLFVIQYLVFSGYTKEPEWKGFNDEVLNGEYYLLPVSRKLMILQILCDDVLESEEVKAEMNTRKESEVGMDYDAEEDILPAETGPRKVNTRSAKTSSTDDKEAMKFVSASNAVNQSGNSISHFRDTESTDDGDVDRNGDECRLCGMDGTLLCCDGCPSAYHSRCIGVMKMFIPDGPWYCPECKINLTEPTIAKGTSLKGAEIFGRDLYGQLFMGTCGHLLVVNIGNNEFHLKYYNQSDIPKVVQVLYESVQHRPIYDGICMAVLQYWNLPANFLPHSVSTITNVNSENMKEETECSSLLPPLREDNHISDSLLKLEYPTGPVSLIHTTDDMMPSHDVSSVMTQSPAPESSGNAGGKECSAVNMKIPEETGMELVISGSSVSISHQTDMNYQNSVNISSAEDLAKCSLGNSSSGDYCYANDMRLPVNFSLQTKESTQVGFGKCGRNVTNDFGYMGFSYKPQSYINYYMHGDFAASAAAKFSNLSSEESRSESHVSDNQRKTVAAMTNLQAKAFSQTAARFFWPYSEKKLVEVPRERCGWCFSCKSTGVSRRGCMLNHAAIIATKTAMKILAGFSPIKSGEGIIPSIATYMIYMEDCLRGLTVGPFLSASYRKHWRKQVEQATTFSAIKPLLLKLEENIRLVAFCGDWVKLMDDRVVEIPITQSAASTLGTAQKRAPSGRRYKKRLATDEATVDDGCNKNCVWWRGDKFTKYIFQKASLPKSMVRKAARQGGLRKISGIFYADGSEIPRRSRRLVWRVYVQMSRNASQLALQVRYLDFYLRWSDLIRPDQNIQEGKGQDTEASAFRNANICDKKLVEGKSCYGIAFGGQKHLPSRVMKSIVEIEKCPEGKEKYWFSETRIPLYLVKEYEAANEKVICDKEYCNDASQLPRRPCKNIFFYLGCKSEKMDMVPCSACGTTFSIRNACQCNACNGFCHEGCSVSSVPASKEVEYLTTCKRCYHAKLLALKATSNESPTSPLLLQGQEKRSGSVFKGPRTKGSHPDVKQVTSEAVVKGPRTKGSHPDMKQVTPVVVKGPRTKGSHPDVKKVTSIVIKGPRPKCHDRTPNSTSSKNSDLEMKQAASSSSTAKTRKNCSWGVIWNKKPNEETNMNFRIKNILLKGESGVDELGPVCHLCKKAYRSDLMYIRCETCENWYHTEAIELEESKILSVFGFKCCKCRRIKSPFCPYSDFKPKTEEVKKSCSRGPKKEYSGADSDSATFSEMKECEPATPIFPMENDPLLFSLSNVELVTEPELDVDIEMNTFSGAGPQKLPVRRQVKREGDGDGDGDGSFGGIPVHADFSTQSEAGYLSNPADLSPLEYDSAVHFDSNLLNTSENLNYDCMDFEPHTYFSFNELLQPDDGSQFEGVDVSGDLSGSGYLENSATLAPEDFVGFSSGDIAEPGNPSQDNDYSCWRCSQMEPVPDLCCEICGVLIHSGCSPWLESPSRQGSWRCGECREWQ